MHAATTTCTAAPSFGRPFRAPALAMLMALALGSAPAGAQEKSATEPQRLPLPRPQAQEEGNGGIFSREFWVRLRDDARRFRELNGGPLHFATRYRISHDLARTIHDAAQDEGIDPELAFRLVRVESNFNPRARSRAGALGLTQLMPYTARWLDRRMTSAERIMEPRANLRTGFRYLRGLIGKYRGDLRLALLAYNRGDGAVDRDLRRGRNPENGYTRMVLGTGLDRYRGSGLRARD